MEMWFMTMIPGLVPVSKPSKPAQLNQYYQNCNYLSKMSTPETEIPIFCFKAVIKKDIVLRLRWKDMRIVGKNDYMTVFEAWSVIQISSSLKVLLS